MCFINEQKTKINYDKKLNSEHYKVEIKIMKVLRK